MPVVGVAAADARQVGPGALRAELERVVVHRFARQRVRPVALGLRAERPDHLRVAEVAALADVDVAARESQRLVRLDARGRLRDRRPGSTAARSSTRPPTLITSAISTPSRPTFFSMLRGSCVLPSGRLHDRANPRSLVRAATVFQTFQAMRNMPASTSVPPAGGPRSTGRSP